MINQETDQHLKFIFNSLLMQKKHASNEYPKFIDETIYLGLKIQTLILS